MKDKIMSWAFILCLFMFPVLSFFNKEDISYQERRKLASFPKFSINSVNNKQFMNRLDNYLTDNFYRRDIFRSIKAYSYFNIFGFSSYNDLFIEDDYIFKLEDISSDDAKLFASKIKILYDDYLSCSSVYLAIIPDKFYYLESNKYIKPDYDLVYKTLEEEFSYLNYIDLRDSLSLQSYYKTDLHWKQEEILPVVDKLSEQMDFKANINRYEEEYFDSFYGSYYGQLGLKKEPDRLTFLTSDLLEDVSVSYIDSKFDGIYNIDKLNGIDPYDVYLNGATPLVSIFNPKSNNNKELIIFRDSFASSLTPLLVSSYKKITLVDLRYGNMSLFEEKLDFNNSDVLILYNSLIVKDSNILKIS